MRVIKYKDKIGIIIYESSESYIVTNNRNVFNCNSMPVAMFEDGLCALDDESYEVLGEYDDRTE